MGGGWRPGGTWIPGGDRVLVVAGMISGEDDGPKSPGRDPQPQVEARGCAGLGYSISWVGGPLRGQLQGAGVAGIRVCGRPLRWILADGAAVRGGSGQSCGPGKPSRNKLRACCRFSGA